MLSQKMYQERKILYSIMRKNKIGFTNKDLYYKNYYETFGTYEGVATNYHYKLKEQLKKKIHKVKKINEEEKIFINKL